MLLWSMIIQKYKPFHGIAKSFPCHMNFPQHFSPIHPQNIALLEGEIFELVLKKLTKYDISVLLSSGRLNRVSLLLS